MARKPVEPKRGTSGTKRGRSSEGDRTKSAGGATTPRRQPPTRAANKIRSARTGTRRAATEEGFAAQLQQISGELGSLRSAVQELGVKLDLVLRFAGLPGERDPGDAVPPGVAVQFPEPLSPEDQAIQDKLEHDMPNTAEPEPK